MGVPAWGPAVGTGGVEGQPHLFEAIEAEGGG